MEIIDRVALVVTPKRRYLDWLRKLSDVPRVHEAELPSMTSVFLVVALDDVPDLQGIVDEVYDELFEQMLGQWTEDEALWPVNRTAHVFRDWFDVQMFDYVVDLASHSPWIEDEEDDLISHACGWCGTPFEEDSEIVTLGAKAASRTLLEGLDGEIIPFPVGDRTVAAIVAAEDSEARRDGRDLMFALCSEECANALRQALERTKAAILS